MGKSLYDKVVNSFFIVMVGLTFFSLFRVIIWLSLVLAVLFLIAVLLHVRDYRREAPQSKRIFILTLIILINFFLANSVVVLGNYIYPY